MECLGVSRHPQVRCVQSAASCDGPLGCSASSAWPPESAAEWMRRCRLQALMFVSCKRWPCTRLFIILTGHAAHSARNRARVLQSTTL